MVTDVFSGADDACAIRTSRCRADVYVRTGGTLIPFWECSQEPGLRELRVLVS